MKKLFSVLAVASVLAGCVNLHVYFPSAPPERGADAAKPENDTGGAKK